MRLVRLGDPPAGGGPPMDAMCVTGEEIGDAMADADVYNASWTDSPGQGEGQREEEGEEEEEGEGRGEGEGAMDLPMALDFCRDTAGGTVGVGAGMEGVAIDLPTLCRFLDQLSKIMHVYRNTPQQVIRGASKCKSDPSIPKHTTNPLTHPSLSLSLLPPLSHTLSLSISLSFCFSLSFLFVYWRMGEAAIRPHRIELPAEGKGASAVVRVEVRPSTESFIPPGEGEGEGGAMRDGWRNTAGASLLLSFPSGQDALHALGLPPHALLSSGHGLLDGWGRQKMLTWIAGNAEALAKAPLSSRPLTLNATLTWRRDARYRLRTHDEVRRAPFEPTPSLACLPFLPFLPRFAGACPLPFTPYPLLSTLANLPFLPAPI